MAPISASCELYKWLAMKAPELTKAVTGNHHGYWLPTSKTLKSWHVLVTEHGEIQLELDWKLPPS